MIGIQDDGKAAMPMEILAAIPDQPNVIAPVSVKGIVEPQ